MNVMNHAQRLNRRIRVLLIVFIVCLVVSGLTAFPLNAELRFLSRILGIDESGTSNGVEKENVPLVRR